MEAPSQLVIVIVLIHLLVGMTRMDLGMTVSGTLLGPIAENMGMGMKDLELSQTKRAAFGESDM